MNRFLHRVLWVLSAPARAITALLRGIIGLTEQQIRSLLTVAMLAGIIALSAENWALIGLAHHAVSEGESMKSWFTLIVERLRYTSGLQAFFALIVGAVTIGADYVRVKIAGHEAAIGRE